MKRLITAKFTLPGGLCRSYVAGDITPTKAAGDLITLLEKIIQIEIGIAIEIEKTWL